MHDGKIRAAHVFYRAGRAEEAGGAIKGNGAQLGRRTPCLAAQQNCVLVAHAVGLRTKYILSRYRRFPVERDFTEFDLAKVTGAERDAFNIRPHKFDGDLDDTVKPQASICVYNL